jgi:hypothetical protein
MASAPTRDIGSIDLRDALGTQMADLQEFVPDLQWPLSVQMYARMRHDPKLTAVLAAYFLPILRATWVVDGAGCRDEVTQLVADDLGLPIRGVDPEPTGARRRGVNWGEHLRLALLSLAYGFMPFERRYEIRGQQARLINLGERMPWTISEIDLNRDGTIRAVTQDIAAAAQMPANRLVWYVHNREGATWTGRSVLRPAYGPWLLKHEMWRVAATSNRRFGMGVPNVEAPPGATPAQVIEAQRLASSMRVGDQSGVGVPNGFKINLTGMTGSAPDTLGLIRYFDQQMSTFALAGFLDLGQTETGSRALGESFVDLFMLSLQAIADEIALVATSGQPGMTGAVTDIVDLNWGEDEPAPRVVCTDVGRRHDLTAEAINGLIESGAITADPDLEAYLRGAFRLPARAQEDAASGRSYEYDLNYGVLTIDERRAQIGLPALPNGEGNRLPEPSNVRTAPAPSGTAPGSPGGTGAQGRPAPVAAKTRTQRRGRARGSVRAAGDPTIGYRQLTTIEAASGMDPDAVQSSWETALDRLVKDWAKVAKTQRKDLADQIRAAVDDDAVDRLAGLTVDSQAGADLLAAAMTALALKAVDEVDAEAAAQNVQLGDAVVDADRLGEVAAAVAAIVAGGAAASAGREALRVWTPGRSGEDVAGLVTDHLEGLSDSYLREQLGGALSAAQNAGRMAAMQAAPNTAEAEYYASEVLDTNTCTACTKVDGTKFDSLAAAGEAYAAGGYIECLGRLRCRGIFVAIWNSKGSGGAG